MLDEKEVRQAAVNIRQLGDYLLFSAGSDPLVREVGIDLVALSVKLRDRKEAA